MAEKKKLVVRVDSCLLASDSSHVLVNAVLPDGRILRDASLPIPGSPEALALSCLAYAGATGGYRTFTGFTGLITVEEPDAPAPAAEEVAAPEEPAPPAAVVTTVEPPTDEPKAVGVGDGAKGKQK